MIPCVILASTPRTGSQHAEDLAAFKREYYDFLPGPIRSEPLRVQLRDHDDQDGGNGTGREPAGAPMNPAIGSLGKTIWDFAAHPANANRDVRFPKPLRFELCLFFNDIGQAHRFLTQEDSGQRVRRIFEYVEIVALSTPAFAPMPGKAPIYA